MAGTEKQPLVAPLQTIGKNGFLYVYVSNESPQDVYFDDLTVKHFTGPLQQEQSFYPFGLQMAAISSKALLKTNVPFKYNAGNELEEEGSLNYYNTFYRKYDAQLGRFTGIDIRAEESYGMSVYNYGANNPVLYNDPMGDMFDTPRNPASFSNAGELLQYIIQNGIDGFLGSHEFLWWSFMDAGGTGGGTLSGFYYGDDFSVGTSKSGESGLYFSFNGFVRDATNNGFNNPSNTLNSFVLGTKFISLQNLWNGAMQYGENNRMAEEGWFSSQSYDVMDQHNYAAFKSRMYGGRPLQCGNDRKSYTESLASFKARYAREVDGRNFEMGFVGVMGAPLVAFGLAEAGIGAAIAEGTSTINSFLVDKGIDVAICINMTKNTAIDYLGGFIVKYGPESMIFNASLFSALNSGFRNIDGNAIYSVLRIASSISSTCGGGKFIPSGMPPFDPTPKLK
jgi:RHS repeat-associated protein